METLVVMAGIVLIVLIVQGAEVLKAKHKRNIEFLEKDDSES